MFRKQKTAKVQKNELKIKAEVLRIKLATAD